MDTMQALRYAIQSPSPSLYFTQGPSRSLAALSRLWCQSQRGRLRPSHTDAHCLRRRDADDCEDSGRVWGGSACQVNTWPSPSLWPNNLSTVILFIPLSIYQLPMSAICCEQIVAAADCQCPVLSRKRPLAGDTCTRGKEVPQPAYRGSLLGGGTGTAEQQEPGGDVAIW